MAIAITLGMTWVIMPTRCQVSKGEIVLHTEPSYCKQLMTSSMVWVTLTTFANVFVSGICWNTSVILNSSIARRFDVRRPSLVESPHERFHLLIE